VLVTRMLCRLVHSPYEVITLQDKIIMKGLLSPGGLGVNKPVEGRTLFDYIRKLMISFKNSCVI